MPWHLFILSVVLGIAHAFFHPAYTAAVSDVGPRVELPSANSRRSLSLQTASIVGPTLGGFMVAASGTAVAIAQTPCDARR